jgi:hypothetical protein
LQAGFFRKKNQQVDDAVELPEALEQNIHHDVTFWLNGYKKIMLAIVNKSGYTSFIGIEYERERLTEVDGIKATIKLINNCSK